MLKRITLFTNFLKFMLIICVALASGITTAQDEKKTNQEKQASDEEEFQLEEIVVTGSRIVRRDFESSSPIVTLNNNTFEERSSIGLEAAMNQLPQFVPAGTQLQASDAGTPFPKSSNAPGAATANLRGLGTNRTLVLVNGKRVQPVNAMLVVDLNTIPTAAVESVEVITGGAAAVYGADAIAGVVNLKLKKNFEGADFDVQYGITEEGDGDEYQFSGLFGSKIADERGNVMLGFNYSNRKIVYGKDRDFITDGWKDPGTNSGGLGTSNLSAYNLPTGFGALNTPTAAWPGVSAYYIDQTGHLFDANDPLNAAHPYTGPISYESGFKINPNGSLAYINKEDSYLQLPMERYAIFGSSTYNLTDTLEFFMDLRYSETEITATGNDSSFFSIWNINMPYNHLYDDPDSAEFGQGPFGFAHHPVPAELADLLNTRPDPDGTWSYQGAFEYMPPYQTVTTSNVLQASGGLRGEFGSGFTDDWTWEMYFSHGKSTIDAQQLQGFLSLRNSRQVIEADQYGKGWENPEMLSVAGSCTSGVPIFNEDGSVNDTPYVSQDCEDYMTLRMNSITSLVQNNVEANMQGSIYELPWSGKIQFAAGADYREETFKFISDSGYNALQDFANVVGNIALPLNVMGSTNVKEVYAELLIPVVKDLPLIKSFNLEPGWRYSNYSISEKVDTYKLMADWSVTDWVRFRGGVQRANRAPNIAELFTPIGASTIDMAAPDACGNWVGIPSWGNKDDNPNRFNLQTLCQHLMVREGSPASDYVPGEASANNWAYNVFNTLGEAGWFPYDLAVEAGNPNLESEKADTLTVGVVIDMPFKVPALQDMRLSIDYYDIEVKGAIDVPSHNTVYSQCLDAQYNTLIASAPGTYTGEQLAAGSPFCSLIHREYSPDNGGSAHGADRRFDAAFINQGAIISKGFDVQFDWGAYFSEIGLDSVPGRLGLNIVVSILKEYSESPFPGAPFVDYTGTVVNASYDYRTLTTLSYMSATGAVSGGLRWRHLPTLDSDPALAETYTGVTSSYDQFDLFGRWTIKEGIELRGGIDNLLYAKPRVIGANDTSNAKGSAAPGDDILGRRFYVGAKFSF